MRPQRPSLTEKTAAIAWARAHNTRDIGPLAPLVHDALHISNQRWWAPQIGGEHYITMLGDFFECVPIDPSATRMELATVPQGRRPTGPPRPCVIEYRHGRPTFTVLFRVRAGKILHIEKRLIPPPTECVLTGICPGLENDCLEEVN